jgi:hypothetical protein
MDLLNYSSSDKTRQGVLNNLSMEHSISMRLVWKLLGPTGTQQATELGEKISELIRVQPNFSSNVAVYFCLPSASINTLAKLHEATLKLADNRMLR